MEGVVEAPSFFLCPIALQIMRDPVTLPTGITYDRESIERWIFVNKRYTCPLTNQSVPLDVVDFITPNHTLRRLIQSWCTTNASEGFERFPTPRPPITRSQIVDLVEEAKSNPSTLRDSLKKLKSIVGESERNKRCVEASGAVDFLIAIVGNTKEEIIVDDVLSILYSIQISEQGLFHLLENNEDFIETLTSILRKSNDQSRAYATLLVKSLISAMSPLRVANLKEEFYVEMVNVLKDRISYQAMKAALQVIGIAARSGRNKISAVNARAVPVLIELLVDENEKKISEMILVVLSRLSECAEGREEIVSHALGIAVLSKKLVRVSLVASERAVRIMHSIAKCSPNPRVLTEMLEVGVVSKLCLLIQVDCGDKTKERVKEMLRLHARVWRNSPCISPQLHSSYPSS